MPAPTKSTLEELRQRNRQVFRQIATEYDSLRFLHLTAERFVEHARLFTGARVLDVASGTGTAAFAAAAHVGPAGTVIGVDLSAEMLAVARGTRARLGLDNVHFLVGDASRLGFAAGQFDVVLCASSLFFMPDMAATLAEWRRITRPGGVVGFSCFGEGLFQPMERLWAACLERHGIKPQHPPIGRLKDTEICRQLMKQAGLRNVHVRSEQLGYHLDSLDQRWQLITSGLEGVPLASLNPEQIDALRAEHLQEVQTLLGSQGYWLDVPAQFVFGTT